MYCFRWGSLVLEDEKTGPSPVAYEGTELRLRFFLLPDKKKEVITNMMVMITNSSQMSH